MIKVLQEKIDNLRDLDWFDPSIKDILIKNIQLVDYLPTVGYWRDTEEESSDLPWPIENSISNSITEEEFNEFIKKLDFVENKIIDGKIGFKLSYMGKSVCRCCNQKNGNTEFIANGIKWPIGYRHYLVAHKVMPEANFLVIINHIYEYCNKK